MEETLMNENNTVIVSKSILCQKIIDEANRAIDFLEAIRAYAAAVTIEETKREQRHQCEECDEPCFFGDFMNDPENLVMRHRRPTAEQPFNECVIPESRWTFMNDLLPFAESPEAMAKKIKEFVEHSDSIQFPKEYFKDYIEDETVLDEKDASTLRAILKKIGMPDEVVNQYIKG